MDTTAILFFVFFFIYLVLTRTKSYRIVKLRHPKLGFKDFSFLYNEHFLKHDEEFDDVDLKRILASLNKQIRILMKGKGSYDILFLLRVSVEKQVEFKIEITGNSQINSMEFSKILSAKATGRVKKFPRFFDVYYLFRYNNKGFLFTQEQVDEFTDKALQTIISNRFDRAEKEMERFIGLELQQKFDHLQEYVSKACLPKLRNLLIFEPDADKDHSFLIKELYGIEQETEIETEKFTSNLEFWLSQISLTSYQPAIPILLSLFFIKNRKYDLAGQFYRLGYSFSINFSWLSQCSNYLKNYLNYIKQDEIRIIEAAELLIDQDKLSAAEEMITDYLELNPWSAQANDLLLQIDKLRNFNQWNTEDLKAFEERYRKKIFQQCDPLFQNGNLINMGNNEIRNSWREEIKETSNLYEAYFNFIKLNVPLLEAAFAIMLFTIEKEKGQVVNLNSFALSISNVVDMKLNKIEKKLNQLLIEEDNANDKE